MGTLRQVVSSIRGMHKLLSSDGLITDRVIASEIRSNTALLVKRETNLRKLWNTDTIFTTIPCMEMKEVSIAECCDYEDECTIARTIHKLPRVAEGNYNYVIQGVYSINVMGGKGKRIDEVTINRYLNLLKLPLIRKKDYFFINNDYLYVTNPLVHRIRLVAFFTEDVPNEVLYYDCDCGREVVNLDEICKNPLDKPFNLPSYLEQQVLAMTSEKLMKTYFATKTDLSDDNIDAQSPNIEKK